MNDEQIRWLTWGAIQLRPPGAPKWDEPGVIKAIRERCGSWELATAIEHVTAHARDPKAKTPFAMKGPAPHVEATKPTHSPPKPDDACPLHGGWLNSCGGCAADRLAGDAKPERVYPVPPGQGKAYADQIRAEISERKASK